MFGLKLYFFDFKPGDVLDVKLTGDNQEYSRSYIMFPEGNNSTHVVWQNEYNVLEAFEFTGDFSFNTKHEKTTFTKYQNLVETIFNLENKDEQRVVVNTGWILKNNHVLIHELQKAKKVWFVNNEKEISITTVGMEMTNEDSEQELYEYDVEFIINKANDLQVYTS